MADLSRKERIPTKNMKNTRGNTRGNTRESLKPTRFDYTCARSSRHKEIHDPRSTKDDTSSTIFSVRRS